MAGAMGREAWGVWYGYQVKGTYILEGEQRVPAAMLDASTQIVPVRRRSHPGN
jgi:hypothetical protein